jgi:predicted metal-dependent hydrolase
MGDTVALGDMVADVVRKKIKHVHLSVYPPEGRVRISAPTHMDLATIRVFAISKLGWIRSQQHKVQAQERELAREYLDRESHYVWGKRYLLRLHAADAAPQVELKHAALVLTLRPDSDAQRRHEVLEAWYREQVRAAVPALLQKWEPVLGVQSSRVLVQRMRTQWGSCNPVTGNIRLNTDLAKKPPQCLEYIVVHELAHLIEASHNARFTALLDMFLPNWQQTRDELNRLPVRHEDWVY